MLRVEQGTIIKMQNERRRVRRNRIDLVDRRQPLLGELMRRKAADHAYPLRGRRDRHLLLQHRHGVDKAAHSVPAQLHIEVDAAPDDVQMVVDQAR